MVTRHVNRLASGAKLSVELLEAGLDLAPDLAKLAAPRLAARDSNESWSKNCKKFK